MRRALRTEEPELILGDLFRLRMVAVEAEYERQMSALVQENLDLREKLDAVLASTWRLQSEEWVGKTKRPEQGTLHLICQPPGQVDGPGMLSAGHRVSEDAAAIQAQKDRKGEKKEVRFIVRFTWPPLEEVALSAPPLGQFAATGGGPGSTPGAEIAVAVAAAKSDGDDVVDKIDGERIVGQSSAWPGRWVVHPASTARLAWDFVGMVMIFYDFIMIPMGLYLTEEVLILSIMDWITLVFWTSDMIASLFTGYVNDGTTIMDPMMIAKNYLRTWFALDLIANGPDWASIIASLHNPGGNEANGSGVARLARVLRAFRVMRLLRITKMARFLKKLHDRIESELVFILMGVVQYFVALLFINHLLGAAWYFVGELSRQDGYYSWTEDEDLPNQPLLDRYSASVHWCWASFALGEAAASPQNVLERLYAVLVMVVGMVVFYILVAQSTEWMLRIRDITGKGQKELWLLRRYIRQRNVGPALSKRILRFLEEKLEQELKNVKKESIPILKDLSEPLHRELDYVVRFSGIRCHPLLEYAENVSYTLMLQLADRTLTRGAYADQDVLFRSGNLAPQMIICVSGNLSYKRSSAKDGRNLIVSRGYWVSEQTLWVTWACKGDLRAEADCELLLLDAALFAIWAKNDQTVHAIMAGYAEVFVQWLNEQEPLALSDVMVGETSREFIRESALRMSKVQDYQDDA